MEPMSTAEDAPLEPNHENMPTNRASVTKTQTTLEIIVKYFFTGYYLNSGRKNA